MPTVRPCCLYFVSRDGGEPLDVHVGREDCSTTCWLDLVALSQSLGFDAAELLRLERLAMANAGRPLQAWDGYLVRSHLGDCATG